MATRATAVKTTKVKFNVGDVLMVRWFDAHNHESGWEEFKDLKCEPCEVWSVGFFLTLTEHEIVLAGDLIWKDITTNTRMAIPLGMVREMKKVHNARQS